MSIEDLGRRVTGMAERAIAEHPHRVTRKGNPMPSALQPIVDLQVELPPEYMLALARDPSLIPMQIGGYDVRISEKPSTLNRPSNRYFVSVGPRIWDERMGRLRKPVGICCLSDAFGPEIPA